jgi:hypothetical protein
LDSAALAARAQRFNAAIDKQAGFVKSAIERKLGARHSLGRQADAVGYNRQDHRTMNRRRHAVDEAQPIERDQRLFLSIGEAFTPMRWAKGEHTMRRRASRRQNRLGETREIGWRPFQGRRRDESPPSLTATDQALVNENLDGARNGEATDPKTPRKLRFAADPVAGRLVGHLDAQTVDQLHVERPIG